MKTVLSLVGMASASEVLALAEASEVWDGIEVSGAELESEPALEHAGSAFGLGVLAVASLLPEATSRYLPENPPPVQERVLAHARLLLDRAASLEVYAATLDLGLDRLVHDRLEADVATRVQLLRSLMAVAERLPGGLCLPLRLPPAMSASTPDTLRVVRDVMHPHCRVAVDVFPDELAADFDLRAALKEFYHAVSIIRWRYRPDLGEALTEEQHGAWAATLRDLGYTGLVVFAPAAGNPAQLQTELAQLAPAVSTHWRP